MDSLLNDFMDVGLVRAGMELFARRNLYSDWLVPEDVKPRAITAKEFRELALTTEDWREINSIAFFCWTCNFGFRTFAGRLCKKIAQRGSYDVFSSVMLMTQPDIPKEGKQLFLEVLAEHPGSTVFEVVVSLIAIKDCVNGVTAGRLLGVAAAILKRTRKPDIYSNRAFYKELIDLGGRYSEAPSIFKVFNKLLGKVPKANSSLVAEAETWGFTYLDVLKLLFSMSVMDNRLYGYTTEYNLKKALLEMLFAKPSVWTEDEVQIVKECTRRFYKHNTEKLVCAKNAKEALATRFPVVIGLDCRDCKELLELKPEQLLGLLLASVDTNQLHSWHDKFSDAFKQAFLCYERRAQNLFNCICSLDFGCYSSYLEYWAGYLSLFNDHSAFDLLQQLEFGTTAYCNLMQHCVTNSLALSDEENAILEKEVLKFVILLCPDRYATVFEGEVDDDGYDNEYDDEYFDDDEY